MTTCLEAATWALGHAPASAWLLGFFGGFVVSEILNLVPWIRGGKRP